MTKQTIDIGELMSRKEDLRPELADSLTENSALGTMISHPLVHEVFYTPALNALYNAQYQLKHDAVEEALRANQWSRVLVMHERPWRWWALEYIAHDLTNQELAEQFAWVWTDSENIWQSHATIQKLMLRLRDPALKPFLMDEEDLAHYNALPETIKVYRGCQQRNRRGLSWTQDKAKAQWFAQRFKRSGESTMVLEGTIAKEDVLFYTNGRGEQEIVATAFELVKHPQRVNA